MAAKKRPYQYYDSTISICSTCLRRVDATIVFQDGCVLKPGGRIGISDFFVNAPVPDSLDGLLGRVLCVAAAPSADGYPVLADREALIASGGAGYLLATARRA